MPARASSGELEPNDHFRELPWGERSGPVEDGLKARYCDGVRVGKWSLDGRARGRRADDAPARHPGTFRSWALVVQAAAAEPAVAECRRRFDPGAAAGMPPHLTVLYPLTTYDHAVRGALTKALADHVPFHFELVQLGHFRHVVYLAPKPHEPFIRLTETTAECLGIAPYEGQFENVVPHVTVAMRRRLPRSVRQSLIARLPIPCEAQLVDVLGERGGRWTVVDSLPLGRHVSMTG